MTEHASAAAAQTNGQVQGVVAARDLARRFGEGDTAVDALRGVSLAVEQAKLTAIMGPSGSGKSTLMHLLAGLDRPTGGSVEIAGSEIGRLDDTELTRLRRGKGGLVFPGLKPAPGLPAGGNGPPPPPPARRRRHGG